MEPFKKYITTMDFTKALKTAGIALLAIVLLSIVIGIGQTFLGRRMGGYSMGGMVAPSAPVYDSTEYYGEATKGYAIDGASAPSLSYRNILPIPSPSGTTGNTAEEFEVTDYTAHIETRHLDETCGAIAGLKAQSYVIFENANTYDRGCSYTFKVERAHVEEIVSKIEALDPKTLSENTYTIKRQIDDFTSQEEIWKNKLTSIDQTLRNAGAAYDELTRLATRVQDVETLAKVIDSKIQVVERLTLERIAVSEQLDRLSRAKADQLDRLEYTYFNVSVSENRYVDGEQLADSWNAAIREFVQTLNEILQNSTINLALFLVFLAQVALYAVVLLLIAKYGWTWVKKIWQR